VPRETRAQPPKPRPLKAAKAAAAAAAAADDDDEPWVVDMQTHVPLDKQETTEFDPIPLPDLPSLGEHDDETEEARKGRYAEDDAVIAEARKIRESRAVLGAKIAKGPYGVDKRKSHWDYVLIEMRWMAADFAAERDWRLEAARQCAEMSAACEGAPPAREETSEEAALEEAGRAMCARVAHEVGHFWEKAWKRAVTKPIPTAAELVPEPKDDDAAKDGETGPDDKKEDEGKEGGRASRRAAAAAAETATPPNAEKSEPTVEATPEKKEDKAPNPNGDEAGRRRGSHGRRRRGRRRGESRGYRRRRRPRLATMRSSPRRRWRWSGRRASSPRPRRLRPA
jgi:hypothetical protein